MAAMDNLKELADRLPAEAYSFLERAPPYAIKTAPRQQTERLKQQVIKSVGSRRSTYSRRWSPSSNIAPSPATGVIV
jgi:hypothetical protein